MCIERSAGNDLIRTTTLSREEPRFRRATCDVGPVWLTGSLFRNSVVCEYNKGIVVWV